MYYAQTGCFSVLGSMTQALRAQKLLAAAAIPTDVVKADTESTGRGCAYALSYACAQQDNVRRLLEKSGIRVRSQTGGRQ